MELTSINPSSPSFANQQLEETKSSWSSSIRNLLFGRGCDNWEKTAIVAMAFAKTFFALANFFLGSFVLSGFFLVSVAIDMLALRIVQQAGTFKAKLREMNQANAGHQANNFKHRIENDRLEKTNQSLAEKVQSLSDISERNEATARQYEDMAKQYEQCSGAQTAFIQTFRQQLTDQGEMTAETRGKFQQMISQLDAFRIAQNSWGENFQAMITDNQAAAEGFKQIAQQITPELHQTLLTLGQVQGQLQAEMASLERIRQAADQSTTQMSEAGTQMSEAGTRLEQATANTATLQAAIDSLGRLAEAFAPAQSSRGSALPAPGRVAVPVLT